MSTTARCLAAYLVAALLFSSARAESSNPYRALAYLAGHCWSGELPAQGLVKQVDTHCFSWVYGGRFLRDQHTVRFSDGRPDYQGETIYWWDGEKKQVQYLYFESQGGVSQGAVQTSGDALVFPDTDYMEDGKTQTYRSRWQKQGEGAYDVLTEFKTNDGWKLGWAVHMQLAPES